MQATVLKYLLQQRGLLEERWDWENRSHQPPDTTVAAAAAVCKCSLLLRPGPSTYEGYKISI